VALTITLQHKVTLSREDVMARNGYTSVLVEVYETARTGGKHGRRHIRPAPDQPFPQHLDVECGSTLTERYPVGTILRMDVREKLRNGDGLHLYSSWQWEPEVIARPPNSN
jgi:hypothetical protein